MTLDDIQGSITQGDRAIKKALEIVEEYIQRHPEKKDSTHNLILNAKRKIAQLPPAFLNQIKVTKKYSDYIESSLSHSKNPVEASVLVMNKAHDDANRKILDAKESRTKRNREMEKNIVIKYIQNNHLAFVALFELYNIFQDIKTEINR